MNFGVGRRIYSSDGEQNAQESSRRKRRYENAHDHPVARWHRFDGPASTRAGFGRRSGHHYGSCESEEASSQSESHRARFGDGHHHHGSCEEVVRGLEQRPDGCTPSGHCVRDVTLMRWFDQTKR